MLRPLRHLYYDTYLTCAYLLIKLLYTGNVVGQLFLLDRFLGTDFRLYGVSVMQRMLAGEDWTTSSKFPRVTLCDFEIRSTTVYYQHRRRSSVNFFWGGTTFLPENMYEKITKCPNFT